MLLIDRDWKAFKLESIFTIYTGTDLIINKAIKGDIPIISHSAVNNGVACWSKPIPNRKLFSHKRTISLADRGNFKAFIQRFDFYIGTRVKALEAKNEISVEALCFIVTLVDKQAVKFSYGYNACDNVGKINIMLPIDENGNPDYAFMEAYVKEQEAKKKQKYLGYIRKVIVNLKYKKIPRLQEKEWKDFYITDVFTIIKRGKRLTKANQVVGNIPYVSSSASNNGVNNFINNTNSNVRKFSNCISLANSGSVGSSFYEPFVFAASDHITHLKNKNFNLYIYLFIATLTNRLSEKYNFNREINDARISREKILLPINKKNEPDYEYMEQYTKNTMYSKLNEYLNFVK